LDFGPATRRCDVFPILDLNALWCLFKWGKKKKKNKKSTNSNFGFHIGYFGMPAEANFGGALAVT
jgi:hypothetical protein